MDGNNNSHIPPLNQNTFCWTILMRKVIYAEVYGLKCINVLCLPTVETFGKSTDPVSGLKTLIFDL